MLLARNDSVQCTGSVIKEQAGHNIEYGKTMKLHLHI